MILSLIAATSRNGVIGSNNSIPWNMPSDMQHFKEYTTGKTLLMGRKTFESIPGLLADRTVIVLTKNTEAVVKKVNSWKIKNPNTEPPLVVVAGSLFELFHSGDLDNCDELVVCGGGTVYEQLYDHCDKFIHTLVNVSLIGTTLFMANRKVDFKNEWIRDEENSVPKTVGLFVKSEEDDYEYYISTFYRLHSAEIYDFATKKKLNKLDQLKLVFNTDD